jgi:hypothetical protein
LTGESVDSLGLQYTLTSGVVAGESYSFRLRAKNVHGWGAYSMVESTVPMNTPAQMSAASTEIDNVYVKVKWEAPDDRGSEITAYRVKVLASDGLTLIESDLCHNSDASLVVTLQCYIPMSEIVSDPIALAYNDLIKIQV